jgi:hypothetical protein
MLPSVLAISFNSITDNPRSSAIRRRIVPALTTRHPVSCDNSRHTLVFPLPINPDTVNIVAFMCS